MLNIVRPFPGVPTALAGPGALFGLEDRILLLRGQIESFSLDATPAGPMIAGDDVALGLLRLDKESAKPIKLVINSPGGDIGDGLIIVDTIAGLRSPLWTFTFGCASFATVIACLGEKKHRYIFPSATCMLHRAFIGIKGEEENVAATMRHSQLKIQKILDLLVVNTELTKKVRKIANDIKEYMKGEKLIVTADGKEARASSPEEASRAALKEWLGTDRYLTPQEAIDYGIVDHIVTPGIQREFFNISNDATQNPVA